MPQLYLNIFKFIFINLNSVISKLMRYHRNCGFEQYNYL